MFNRNRVTMLDPRYEQQQRILKEICNDLGLIPFYPTYHAAKNDNNTVLIYSQKAFVHNAEMDQFEKKQGYRPERDMPYLLSIENTDINGQFSLNQMNRGRLVLTGLSETELKEKLATFIRGRLGLEEQT